MTTILEPATTSGKRNHKFRLSNSYENMRTDISVSLTKDIEFHLKFLTTDQIDLLLKKNAEKDWLLPLHNDSFTLSGFVMDANGWVVEFGSIDGLKTIPVYVDNLNIDNKISLLKIIEEVL